MNEPKQRELPFPSLKEQARLARVERLLSGDLKKHIRPASEMNFNYLAASAIARQSQPTPRRSRCPKARLI